MVIIICCLSTTPRIHYANLLLKHDYLGHNFAASSVEEVVPSDAVTWMDYPLQFACLQLTNMLH